jgi:hypothetical protein
MIFVACHEQQPETIRVSRDELRGWQALGRRT